MNPEVQSEDTRRLSNDVEFSVISGGNYARNPSSAPGSKMKRLKRLLDVADRKRKRLDDLKALGEHGEKQVKEELWVDAMKSASGEKTISDSAKLKKAIKRREKKKESSARKWKVPLSLSQLLTYNIFIWRCKELFYISFKNRFLFLHAAIGATGCRTE
jgi:hypothetical protein